MSFLSPLALLGLLSLPVILVLHLLRNRRKELAISSLRLWRDLEYRKQGALPRRIRLTLMLLLQLLVATAITLALARPASSFLLDQPERTIFILDMTTSMNAVDVSQPGSNTRFDVARQTIQDYIRAMDENDSFAVISLGPAPEILFAGDFDQREAALVALDNLTAGATGADLAAALMLTSSVVDPEQENQIIVLTDGNYNINSQALPSVLAPLEWQMIPAQLGDTSNQALLDVSTQRLPDGRYRVFARVVNYSDVPLNRTLRLIIDDLVSGEDTVEIEPQSDATRAWTLSAQAETAALEIVEPDILPIDNRAELLLLDTSQQRVLLISKTPDMLARALEVQPGVELTVVPPTVTDYNPGDYDLIVFDGLSVQLTAWPRGNVLVVNPPLGHPLLPAESFARDFRPDPSTASSLFNGIDLSGVFFKRVPRLDEPDWAEVDLRSLNTESEPSMPLVFHGRADNSYVMVWAFDLAASNLPARLALPLLTANTLSALLAPSPPASIQVGEPIELAGNFNIETPDGHRLFMDSDKSPTSDGIFSSTKLPGLYTIFNENNAPVAGFVVHAGSPFESNLLQRFNPDVLASIDGAALPFPDIEVAFDEFWPWLATLALAVVMFEGWLAWRK